MANTKTSAPGAARLRGYARRFRAHRLNYGLSPTLARLGRLALGRDQASGYERETPEPPPLAAVYAGLSVIIPVYGAGLAVVAAAVASVEEQDYPALQIVLVDDACGDEAVVDYLRRKAADPRFTVVFRRENGGISRASNDGIAAATGDYCLFLDCDDLLERGAMAWVNHALQEDPALDMLYSDEDCVSADGTRFFQPFCKPDWSPESFWSCMYSCHLMAVRRSLLAELGGFRPAFDGAQDYDLVLRLAERSQRIGHLPRILYHWRARKGSTARGLGEKPEASGAGVRAREEALRRRGIEGRLESVPGLGQARVVFAPPPSALVSIIVPGRDKPELLERCLSSVRARTKGVDYELVFVDNGSSPDNAERYRRICSRHKALYLAADIPFNYSRLNNLAACYAIGDYLCLLNDDTEILQDDWLARMTGQAAQEGVGAVGAKLLYPETGLVQHAGVALLRPGPSHLLHCLKDDYRHYFGWTELAWNVSAVTAACLVVRKRHFEAAGGLDESLPVAYNDVAFCLRLRELGLRNVVRNDVRVAHHESLSRGDDFREAEKRARLARDLAKLDRRYKVLGGEPYYNPLFDQYRVDFFYDTTRRDPGRFSRRKGGPAPSWSIGDARGGTDDTRWKVNLFLVEGDSVHLEGWAFRPGTDSLSLGAELWCRWDGAWWSIPCRRHLRLDVQASRNLGTDGDYSGLYLATKIPPNRGGEPRDWTLVLGRGRHLVAVPLGDRP